MTQDLNYKCLRCGGTRCELGEMHVAGSVLAKVFDVEGRKFSTVTCASCRHTEFFEATHDELASIFDLFVT